MHKPDAVYFFGTCLIDLFYPHAGLSAMRLLAGTGIRVRYPQDQTCCGQPAYNSGYRDQARVAAAAQLDAFPADIPVVVPSASCAGMFRVHYPRLFADTPDEARAQAPWPVGSMNLPSFWCGSWISGPSIRDRRWMWSCTTPARRAASWALRMRPRNYSTVSPMSAP